MILECGRSLKVKGAKLITNVCLRERKKKKKRKLAGSGSRSDQMNSRKEKKKDIRNKQSAYTD